MFHRFSRSPAFFIWKKWFKLWKRGPFSTCSGYSKKIKYHMLASWRKRWWIKFLVYYKLEWSAVCFSLGAEHRQSPFKSFIFIFTLKMLNSHDFMDYYEVLDVPVDASLDVIKRKYRLLALKVSFEKKLKAVLRCKNLKKPYF